MGEKEVTYEYLEDFKELSLIVGKEIKRCCLNYINQDIGI